MAGRKKDYVWQDVTLTVDDKASCNYCDAVISKRPIRIKDQLHLRDGFQHLDLFGVKQEIDLVKRKP